MTSDEYFPRGKVTPAVKNANSGNVPSEKKIKRKKKGIDNLFESSEPVEIKPKKKGKKSKNALTPQEEKALGGTRRAHQSKRFAVVPLSYEQIVEGMLSLGVITKIRDHEIAVNLPGRTSGTVSITDISTPYVKIIEEHASGKGASEEETPIYPLREMFSIGQCVIVKVKSVQQLDQGRIKVLLTMNPKDIYSNYNTTVLKEDILMVAAVSSIEDHGYQMDVGINGARCFLPKLEIEKHRKKPLGIGQLLYCKIVKINVHRLIADIRFGTNAKSIRTQRMDDMFALNYSTLMPGMLVDTVVMETHRTGLMAYCLELNGLVHQDHIADEWDSPESLEVGSSAHARILYVLPNLTTPYLTMQTDLLPLSLNRKEKENSGILGTKQNSRIVTVEKRGLTVRLEESGKKGFVPVKHLGDESLLTVEDISKKFKVNSVHEIRVLQYSPIERTYLCSLRKDKLNNDFVHSEQALPGKKVTCKIMRWNNGGAIVQFGSGMNGFVPNALFRSSKISDAAKEKLIDTNHKAMIVSRDSEKDKIVLTVRKELVKNPGEIISSLGEAKEGMIGLGIIKHCIQSAAFVSTIGGVEGFVPSKMLSKIRLNDVREVFSVGQIIQFKVVEVIPDRNQLLLTTLFDAEEETGAAKEIENKIPEKQKKKNNRKRTRNEEEKESEHVTDQPSTKSKDKKKKKKAKLTDKTKEEDLNGTLECENDSFWDTSVGNGSVADDSDSDAEQPKSKKSKMPKLSVQSDSVLEEIEVKTGTGDEDAANNADLAVKFENGEIVTPNNPFYWMKLMTHYVSVGNTEKARGIAKQALEIINYRDEKAKLKIWGASLNLELQYGTEDTLKATFSDALQRNDQFEVFKLMALVYDKADRFKDAERIYRQMVRQFRLELDAWVRFGTFYFQRQKCDSARDLLNEALSAVNDNKQILLITKFALLEFHHGEQTRGESMIDRVLTQYPFRCDIWLLYANAFIKRGIYDGARNVFRKALERPWNPRKAKPLLKQFKEFESKHGTEETLSAFQELALKTLDVSTNND